MYGIEHLTVKSPIAEQKDICQKSIHQDVTAIKYFAVTNWCPNIVCCGNISI